MTARFLRVRRLRRANSALRARRGTGLAAAAVLAVSAASCLQTTEPVKKAGARTQQCNAQRDSALDRARPKELGIKFNLDEITGELNRWRRDCLKEPSTELGIEAKALLSRSWQPAQLKQISRGRFDDRDAYHIRNSLLFGAIYREIAKRTPDRNDDLWQVVELFHYVMRNVELIDRHSDSVPMPIFRVMLLGKGTAEDRAWIFAALLRQMQIPAVILSPKPIPAKGDAPFVVGALLENDVYLFDPRLGLPIPASQTGPSQPLVRKPATLKQFVANPSIAKSLSIDGFAYWLKPADLQRPRVQLVGHRSVWAPHMKSLLAPMYKSCIVYVNLDKESQGPGLIQRVSDRGKSFWTKDDLEVWPHPERVFAAFAGRSPQQRSTMDELFRPFGQPRLFQVAKNDDRQELAVGRSSHRQFSSRVTQLEGDYDQCIKNFVLVRTEFNRFKKLYDDFRKDDPAMLKPFFVADDDAEFWLGVSKFEQYLRLQGPDLSRRGVEAMDRLGKALDTLERYPAPHQRAPRWADQARFLTAVGRVELWQAHRGNPAATPKDRAAGKLAAERALDRLKSIARDHPQKHGFELLRRRCLAILKQPVKPRPKRDAKTSSRPPVVAPKPVKR